jgi:dienelactone hydrolase
MKNRPLAALLCVLSSALIADGPKDNLADNVRPVPPPGIKIGEPERAELTAGAAALAKEIESLRVALKGKPALDLLPDVEIYHKAVDWALRYDEFYKTNEVATARGLLKTGSERAAALRAGSAPWLAQTGLVARGYRSRIDGSAQPYGMVVPESFRPGDAPRRLDFWFHGRGEQLTELDFISQRQKSAGEFTPPNAFVLHLYGRYCNANKMAGEMDLFEALAHARRFYPVDDDRLVVRGFSMGGAACWQFAVHYPGKWCAAAPGAGFSETADFLKVFQSETLKPAWFEQKLWHWYDCTDYAANLFNLPTVAYSGEIDKQKQAADIMAKALKAEGMELTHIIGPQTAHKYHPDAKTEINRRIDAIAARGRDRAPEHVRFTTWTLRYNESHWVRVDGLAQHWEEARVEARVAPRGNAVEATTKNVTALTFTMAAGDCPLSCAIAAHVKLDGQELVAPSVKTDRSWHASFHKVNGRWAAVAADAPQPLRKRHGLQGPIDDAFMDSFLMVRPTGAPLNEKVGAWTTAEMAHALDHWRKQFRGDARVKDDTAVTDADLAEHNLILWGDPQSNALLKRLADKLPLHWSGAGVKAGPQSFDASHHASVLIHPNPLNPKKYIVLNSGFTFREYDYLNNARQVAKLPDWAVVDLRTPPNSRWPGAIAAAGFFGERWEFITPPAKP